MSSICQRLPEVFCLDCVNTLTQISQLYSLQVILYPQKWIEGGQLALYYIMILLWTKTDPRFHTLVNIFLPRRFFQE